MINLNLNLIKGEPIILYDKVETGVDEFNAPIYEEVAETIENVLITPEGDEDVTGDVKLHGKVQRYELSIPKGDTHDWIDRDVEFWGHRFKVYGFTRGYIEENVPGPWNGKAKVERYG